MAKRKAEIMIDEGPSATASFDAVDVVESPLSDVAISPTDSGYLESLKEPFHSMAMKVIAATTTSGEKKGDGDDKQDDVAGVDIAHHCLDELEMSLRSRLLDIFNNSNEDETMIRSLVGNYWKSAVDLCLYLVHTCCESTKSNSLALSSPKKQQQQKKDSSTTSSTANAYGGIRKLPLLLLEDVLDGLSVEDAQQFWMEYVEPILDDVLLGDLLWKSSNVCHLPFLRVGNHFLRLLENASHSQEQEWKGRVLLAFSKAFSITDRSALKLWGTFHTNKITKFESKDDYSNASTGKNNQDYNLYEAFWSLQADFSNPNRIQFAAFTKKMKLVLAALESSTVTSTSTTTTEGSSSTPKPESVRYLTSSSLLSTQMASSEFRSSVLIQFLIIGNHLSAESPPLANALSGLIATSRKLLKQDSPELLDILNSILQNGEAQWRKWKKEKCPVTAFAPKQPAGSDTTKPKKRPRLLDGPLSGGSSKKSEYDLKLDTEELIEISQQLADKVPSLEKHLEPYVEALDPESGIEDDYHPKSDPLYCWRAMRLMRIHQPLYLKDCRQPADLELVTRELYKDKGEEIPGEYIPPPKSTDSDSSSADGDAASENDANDDDGSRRKNDDDNDEDDHVAAESATSSKAGSNKGDDNDRSVDDHSFDDADEDGGNEEMEEDGRKVDMAYDDDEGMDVDSNEPEKEATKPETADVGGTDSNNDGKEERSKDGMMSDAEKADDDDEKNEDKDLQSADHKSSEQKEDDEYNTGGETGGKPQKQEGGGDGDVSEDEEKADAKKQQQRQNQTAIAAKKSPPPTAGQKKAQQKEAPQHQSSQKDSGNSSSNQHQQQRPRSTPKGGGGGGGVGGRRGDVRKGGGGRHDSRGRSGDDGPRAGGQGRGGGRHQDSQAPSSRRHDDGPSRRNDSVRRGGGGGRDNDGGQPSRRHDEGGHTDSYRVMASSERDRGGGGGQGRESQRDGGRGSRVSQRDGRAGGDRRDRDRDSDRRDRDRDSDRRDRDRDDRHGGGGGGSGSGGGGRRRIPGTDWRGSRHR